jgi:hypothetical protein
MIRPGLTFSLWLCIAVLTMANNAIGDTWIALSLSVRAVEWYKVLVPLPYIALMAALHAKYTTGPRWSEAAFVAAFLWPSSTVVLDLLYARIFFDEDPASFFERFAFWWGAPYTILIAGLFVLPLAFAALRPNSA